MRHVGIEPLQLLVGLVQPVQERVELFYQRLQLIRLGRPVQALAQAVGRQLPGLLDEVADGGQATPDQPEPAQRDEQGTDRGSSKQRGRQPLQKALIGSRVQYQGRGD